MAPPEHLPFHKDLSRLAFFISIPQLIASPVVVGIQHLVYHDVAAFEVKEVLDFLLISFPLTLCVAILFVIIEKGKFNLFYMLFAVAGAALLSNLLHMMVEEIPSVNLKEPFDSVFGYKNNGGGSGSAFTFVFKMLAIYWKAFGPILFIQSCCIGIFAGVKYLKIEKKKREKK